MIATAAEATDGTISLSIRIHAGACRFREYHPRSVRACAHVLSSSVWLRSQMALPAMDLSCFASSCVWGCSIRNSGEMAWPDGSGKGLVIPDHQYFMSVA